MEEIVVDYWAHRHVDDPKLREEDVNPDFEGDMAEMAEEMGIPPEEAPPDPGDFEAVANDLFPGAGR